MDILSYIMGYNKGKTASESSGNGGESGATQYIHMIAILVSNSLYWLIFTKIDDNSEPILVYDDNCGAFNLMGWQVEYNGELCEVIGIAANDWGEYMLQSLADPTVTYSVCGQGCGNSYNSEESVIKISG